MLVSGCRRAWAAADLIDQNMSADIYIARLKQHGHRVTPKVRAVIALFLKSGTVLDPFEVRAGLQKQFKGVGLPTVYRILEGLARCGILLTAANEDRQLRYYICRDLEAGHHHHFLCRQCGQVEEVNLCLMEEVTQYVKRHLKARVESHFLQIEGLCARCSRQPGIPAPEPHTHKG
jgi:Fur family zinc uptake transcriptional regulator